jgi:hypothetical protein
MRSASPTRLGMAANSPASKKIVSVELANPTA